MCCTRDESDRVVLEELTVYFAAGKLKAQVL